MRYLSTFLTEFRDGFQKSARFTCHFFIPQTVLAAILNPSIITRIIDIIIPGVGSRIDENFSMPIVTSWLQRGLLCEATRTPQRVMSQFNQSMYGFTEHYPVHSEYLQQDCTFLMPLHSSDCPVPRFFNYWLNYIQSAQQGPEDGMDFRFPQDYYGTMVLALYNHKTHPTHAYRFDRVYPRSIDPAALSWENNNQFLTLPVSFTYSYWTMVKYEPPPLIEIDIPL